MLRVSFNIIANKEGWNKNIKIRAQNVDELKFENYRKRKRVGVAQIRRIIYRKILSFKHHWRSVQMRNYVEKKGEMGGYFSNV